jgi:hypothetical protein
VLLTAGDDFRFGMPPLRDSLHLREAAIHEQFRYRDVALLLLAMLSHAAETLAAAPRHLRLVRT